jgi:hypothetical protein
MLLAKVRDGHGQLIPRKIRLDDHIGNTDGISLLPGHLVLCLCSIQGC